MCTLHSADVRAQARLLPAVPIVFTRLRTLTGQCDTDSIHLNQQDVLYCMQFFAILTLRFAVEDDGMKVRS